MFDEHGSHAATQPPPGFEPYPPVSPYMKAAGQLYTRKETDGGITIGLWVEERHLNHQDVMHGGMVASLADNAMGYHAAHALGGAVATVHLAVDYLAPVAVNTWLEVRSRLDRRGKRMPFTACNGMIGEALVFRATAVFSAITR